MHCDLAVSNDSSRGILGLRSVKVDNPLHKCFTRSLCADIRKAWIYINILVDDVDLSENFACKTFPWQFHLRMGVICFIN